MEGAVPREGDRWGCGIGQVSRCVGAGMHVAVPREGVWKLTLPVVPNAGSNGLTAHMALAQLAHLAERMMTRASSSRASISRAVTFLVPGSNCSTFSACSVSKSVSKW